MKVQGVPAAGVPAREGACSGLMIMVASCGCFLNECLNHPRSPTLMGSVILELTTEE